MSLVEQLHHQHVLRQQRMGAMIAPRVIERSTILLKKVAVESVVNAEEMAAKVAAERDERAWSEAICGCDLSQPLMRRAPRILDVQNMVASYYGIMRASLLSGQRNADYVRPRQVAFYLSKILTGRSLPEIGRQFGRDHTTVLHGIRKIGAEMLKSEELQIEVRSLARMIDSGESNEATHS